jgi:hypothetical protein
LEQLPCGDRPSRSAELAELTTSQFALQLASTLASYEVALRTATGVSVRSMRAFLSDRG